MWFTKRPPVQEKKNKVPEPTCQCGGFESSYHFFFVCPIFVDARSRYLPANLNNLTTRDLLFGMENKTNHENEALFMQVQEFKVEPGRFARNEVKHEKTISIMFNAQHRKLVVIPFPSPPPHFSSFFLFICHALMLTLLSVH